MRHSYVNPLRHDDFFITMETLVFIPDDTIISPQESMCLCPKSLISLWKLINLFLTAPCFSLKAPIFMPDGISMTGLKVSMILSSNPLVYS